MRGPEKYETPVLERHENLKALTRFVPISGADSNITGGCTYNRSGAGIGSYQRQSSCIPK